MSTTVAKLPSTKVKEAKNWLMLATKAYHYRKDLLTETAAKSLYNAIEKMEDLLDRHREAKPTEEELDAANSELVQELTASGGNYYHTRSWTDNIEMFLVAIIAIVAIRSFFFQPFKIPTNSMYPTYHGMTYEVFKTPEEIPGGLEKVFRKITLFSKHYSLKSPGAGELTIPININGYTENGYHYSIGGQLVYGRKWFVLPAKLARYTFYVGDKPVSVDVPEQFNMSSLIKSVYGKNASGEIGFIKGVGSVLKTGIQLQPGDNVLSFDILTGDQLFVDRMTYHFREPKVGEPFVFRTDNIPGMEKSQHGKYYIKRIAGKGGDTLQIKYPELYRNGKLAEDNLAFFNNANQIGEYEGYTNDSSSMKYLYNEKPFTIPQDEFFALGDNSDQSLDSRYWGTVPKKEVIGRALIIYYPFTHRWGAAK